MVRSSITVIAGEIDFQLWDNLDKIKTASPLQDFLVKGHSFFSFNYIFISISIVYLIYSVF